MVKKLLIMLLTIIIILTSGCGMSSQKHTYKIYNHDMTDAFDNWNEKSENAVENRKITFFGKDYDIIYDETVKLFTTPYAIDMYDTQDGRYEFGIKADTEDVVFAYAIGDETLTDEVYDINESALKNNAKKILGDMVDITGYKYNIKSEVEYNYENSSNTESFDYYFKNETTDEYYTVTRYRIDYTREISGCMAGDMASVIFDDEGRLKSIDLRAFGALEGYYDLKLDNNAINEIVKQMIEADYNADNESRLKSYDINRKIVLRGSNDDIAVWIFVDVVIENIDKEDYDIHTSTDYIIKVD